MEKSIGKKILKPAVLISIAATSLNACADNGSDSLTYGFDCPEHTEPYVYPSGGRAFEIMCFYPSESSSGYRDSESASNVRLISGLDSDVSSKGNKFAAVVDFDYLKLPGTEYRNGYSDEEFEVYEAGYKSIILIGNVSIQDIHVIEK